MDLVLKEIALYALCHSQLLAELSDILELPEEELLRLKEHLWDEVNGVEDQPSREG